MNNPEYYFRRYLDISPLSHSLWRSIEASEVSRIELSRPIIDIGCWRGEFASVFFDEPIEIGMDISAKDISQARNTGKYQMLLKADARELPFPDNSFNTALAFSVFEHIPNAERAIQEALRVIRPNGQLVFTVPLKKMETALFYPQMFNALGFKNFSALYVASMQRFFKHHNLFNSDEWEKFVKQAGGEIQVSREIIPERIVKMWDLFIPFAATTFINNWKPFPVPGRKQLLTRVFKSKLNVLPEEGGVNLLIAARKPNED